VVEDKYGYKEICRKTDLPSEIDSTDILSYIGEKINNTLPTVQSVCTVANVATACVYTAWITNIIIIAFSLMVLVRAFHLRKKDSH
jgi:hypothetical protein